MSIELVLPIFAVLLGVATIWALRREGRAVRIEVSGLGHKLGERLDRVEDKQDRQGSTGTATLAELRALTSAAARLGPKPGRGPMGSSPDGSGQWRAVQPEEGGGE